MAGHFDKFIAHWPMIHVFSKGGAGGHYDYPVYGSYGKPTLIEELIPHIDKTYRTIANWTCRGSARIPNFSAPPTPSVAVANRNATPLNTTATKDHRQTICSRRSSIPATLPAASASRSA